MMAFRAKMPRSKAKKREHMMAFWAKMPRSKAKKREHIRGRDCQNPLSETGDVKNETKYLSWFDKMTKIA